MMNTSSNRATPQSGNNITKIIRQHYKPKQPTQYEPEHVRCRTETSCLKNKADNYWTTNYCRRRQNLYKGFYTSNTEPYRPIGGDLILDPYELVLSALPGNVEKKFQSRMTRRGTVYESNTPSDFLRLEEQLDADSLVDSDEDEDSCPTAGFNDIKKLLHESRQRIRCVQAGVGYEDHIRRVEDYAYAEEEVISPEDTALVLHTASSLFLPLQNQSDRDYSLIRLKTLDPLSMAETRKLSIFSAFTSKQNAKRISPIRRFSRPASSLRSSRTPILKSPGSEQSETEDGKLKLIRCFSGVTKAIYKKERLLKDQFLYMESIFKVLTAMHNMKLKDIRSKVPLSKELVDKLQKEGHQRDDDRGSRGTYGYKYGRTSKMSTVDIETDQHDGSGRISVLGTVKRMTAVENVGKNYFGRRRSRNATSIYSDKPSIETWEDLLNAQPPEFKEETVPFGFQVGFVTKFMKWYRKASIAPTHTGGGLSTLDRDTISHLSNIQDRSHGSDKADKGDRESVYGPLGAHQSRVGSAHGQTERIRKQPIWQQVAQEKSSVYNKKANAPNVDATIDRLKRNMKKLKCSVQKQNTAELEKIVRERVASFRLKFGTLGEDCSPLFEKQMSRVQRANEINRSQLENLNVQPSKWYEELKETAENMVSQYDKPKINEIIHKLQVYSHMDNKTLPLAKAKLCLLMMSLPAYDICQIYMQKALKLIFKQILLGQGAQFDEWLNLRQIPYVVLEDIRPYSGLNL